LKYKPRKMLEKEGNGGGKRKRAGTAIIEKEKKNERGWDEKLRLKPQGEEMKDKQFSTCQSSGEKKRISPRRTSHEKWGRQKAGTAM